MTISLFGCLFLFGFLSFFLAGEGAEIMFDNFFCRCLFWVSLFFSFILSTFLFR